MADRGYVDHNIAAFSSEQQQATVAALRVWEEVANVVFAGPDVPLSANISFLTTDFARSSLDVQGFAGVTLFPSKRRPTNPKDIFIDQEVAGFLPGQQGFYVLMHEIGHALGFKHVNEDGKTPPPFLPSSHSSMRYTIMQSGAILDIIDVFASTPMLYDIAAIQQIYGANTATRADDTTYSFATSIEEKTIWDGGGIDTFDLSNQPSASLVNLNAGEFSSIGTSGKNLRNIRHRLWRRDRERNRWIQYRRRHRQWTGECHQYRRRQ